MQGWTLALQKYTKELWKEVNKMQESKKIRYTTLDKTAQCIH